MAFTPSGVLETATLNKYIKPKADLLMRKSVFMSGLKAHGRISYGSKNSGKRLEWRPKVKRQQIAAADPYNVNITFELPNRRTDLYLSWVTYNLGTRICKIDRLANQGSDVQYVNLVTESIDSALEDFMEGLVPKLYGDGGSTGSLELMGLESMFSVSGTVSNSWCGNPNDTYASKSTALGALGGDWDGSPVGWPGGSGDTEYCALSPMVWDYTNTKWVAEGATDASWKNVWQRVMNAAITYMGRLHKRRFNMCLINSDLLRQAKDTLIGKEQIQVTNKSKLVDLGYTTLTYEGVELIDEYDVPDLTGYLFNWEDIELHSMQNQLVETDKDIDISASLDLSSVDFYGQLRFESPGLFAKITSVTTGT